MTTDRTPTTAALHDRLVRDFASAFIRIRGAHNPKPGEPCAWCLLAAEQATEAVLTTPVRAAIEDEARAAANVAPATDADGLGAAWRAAEAALPKSKGSWGYIIAGLNHYGRKGWNAYAHGELIGEHVDGYGSTPAAALLALAAALRDRS